MNYNYPIICVFGTLHLDLSFFLLFLREISLLVLPYQWPNHMTGKKAKQSLDKCIPIQFDSMKCIEMGHYCIMYTSVH